MKLSVLILALLCSPAFAWVKIADEGAAFDVGAATRTVRFGAGTSWAEKAMTGPGTCSSTFFGRDPAFGVAKQCQVDDVVSAAPPICLPSDLIPGAHGTPWAFYATPKVQGYLLWCPDGKPATGGVAGWVLHSPAWCLISKCATIPGSVTVMSILNGIRAAGSPAGAAAVANSAASAVAITPAAGSADDIDIKTWRAQACKFMTTPPYPVTPPQGFTPGWVFPAGFCPAEPTPLPPPTSAWIVTPSGSAATRAAYPLINGKRSTSAGSQAVVRTPVPAPVLVEFGVFNYCLVPPVSLVPTTNVPHVTGCTLQK